jgi:hypothetical protein
VGAEEELFRFFAIRAPEPLPPEQAISLDGVGLPEPATASATDILLARPLTFSRRSTPCVERSSDVTANAIIVSKNAPVDVSVAQESRQYRQQDAAGNSRRPLARITPRHPVAGPMLECRPIIRSYELISRAGSDPGMH